MPPVLGPVSPSPTGLWSWQEGMGKDLHSIFKDPEYADSEHADFRLKPGSPNIGAGDSGGFVGFGFARRAFLRLGFIDDAQGESDMHHDVIAHRSLRRVGEVYFLDDAAKADAPGAQQRVFARDAQYFSWNCQTHDGWFRLKLLF